MVAHVHCGARAAPPRWGTAARSIAEIAPLRFSARLSCGLRPMRACRRCAARPTACPGEGRAAVARSHRKAQLCVRHDSRGVYDFVRSHVQPQECAELQLWSRVAARLRLETRTC
jgi:hypothetical protein